MRLASELSCRDSILKTIAVIFSMHIALQTLIQFGSNLKRNTLNLFFSEHLLTYAFQGVTLFVVFLIFASITGSNGSGRKSHLMQLLGDVSYPLYLIHIPIFIVLSKTAMKSPLLYYATSVLGSYAIYRVLDIYSQRREKPVAIAA